MGKIMFNGVEYGGSGGSSSNITYSLSKSGSTISLKGSDGSSSSVTDSNTTYGVATQSADGLMSATDKTELDTIKLATDSQSNTDGVKIGIGIRFATDGNSRHGLEPYILAGDGMKATVENYTNMTQLYLSSIIGTSSVGSSSIPVYFKDGMPVACTDISSSAGTSESSEPGKWYSLFTGSWSFDDGANNNISFELSDTLDRVFKNAERIRITFGTDSSEIFVAEAATASYYSFGSSSGYSIILPISTSSGYDDTLSFVKFYIDDSSGSNEFWMAYAGGLKISVTSPYVTKITSSTDLLPISEIEVYALTKNIY